MNLKYWFKFNFNERGFGDLELFDGTEKINSWPCRTGANHYVDKKLKLVNAIANDVWYITEPPIRTYEKGMYIENLEGFGWKIRLWKKVKEEYQYTHFLIHPDGNAPGTLGCLGLQQTNAPELFRWFEDFYKQFPKDIIPVSINQKEYPLKKESEVSMVTSLLNPTKDKTVKAGTVASIVLLLQLLGVDIPQETIVEIIAILGTGIGLIHKIIKAVKKSG